MAEENGAFVAPGTQIRGRVQGDGDLVVEGSIEGSIAISRTLNVETDGQVDASVEAPQIVVRGQLAGNAQAADLIAIEAGGTVTAKLRAPRITIEEGARLVASFDMDVELPPGVEIPEGS